MPEPSGPTPEHQAQAAARAAIPRPGHHVAYGPTTALIGPSPDHDHVVMRIECVTGMHVHVLDAELAERMSESLASAARQVRSGLTVVGRVPPVEGGG